MVKTCTVVRKKTSSSKKKSRSNRRRSKKQATNLFANSWLPAQSKVSTSTPQAAALWTETYEKCVSWHQSHQLQYWKNLALKLKAENEKLSEQLQIYESLDTGSSTKTEYNEMDSDNEDYTRAEQADNETDDTFESYLDFLEITYKHREELKKKRENESEKI